MSPFALLLAVLVLAQAALAALAPGLSHSSVKTVGDVVPFVALLMLPAALGLWLAPNVERMAPTRRVFAILIATGLAMRLVWLGTPAPLEDDFYRYLWDGAVAVSGQNPYLFAPEHIIDGGAVPPIIAALAKSGAATLARINFPDLTTIYPGGAQLAFALAHRLSPWSIDGLRAIFMLADLATLAVLAALLQAHGRSPLWAACYWLNPLVVLASTATAHVDALLPPLIVGAFLAWRRQRWTAALALLGLATGVKLWPALIGPLLVRDALEKPLRVLPGIGVFALIAGAAVLPLVMAGTGEGTGLGAYSAAWHNNNAPFAWMVWGIDQFWGEDSEGPERLLRLAIALAGIVAAMALALRPVAGLADHLGRALALTAILFYLSPAQFPWYALTFLAFASVCRSRPLLLASVLLPLYYLFFPMMETDNIDFFQEGLALLHAAPVWGWVWWTHRRRLFERGAAA